MTLDIEYRHLRALEIYLFIFLYSLQIVSKAISRLHSTKLVFHLGLEVGLLRLIF